MIRKVMPKVIANSIIGTQPMTGPTGSIFSMNVRYSTDEADYFGVYQFNEDARFKKHWLALEYKYPYNLENNPLTIFNVRWTDNIRPKLLEMFGEAGPSNDFRWNHRLTEQVVLTFTTKSDITLFMLWFKGQNSKTIQDG